MKTASAAPSDYVFVHVHIHKCAGKAFGDLIHESFGAHHLDMYRDDIYTSWRPDEVASVLAAHPRIYSVASHNFRLFADDLAGRKPLYTCFLRQPLDWFVSYLTYIKSSFSTLAPVHQQALPGHTATIPLADLAAHVLREFSEIPTAYNTFVRYLAESTFREHLRQMDTAPAWNQSLKGVDAAFFDAHGLSMAKKILTERFFFVGMVEQMPRSLKILRQRLARKGFTLLDRDARQINVSRQFRDDLRWLEADQPLGQLARTVFRDDLLLYDWALQRFNQIAEE